MALPSPSSSAVTIPTPGKSILKRPPPPQQSLFSRLTKFLPQQPTPSGDGDRPLKRAHFILPQIATVYSISTAAPPSTPNVKEEMRATEERERERRRRVVRSNSHSSSPGTPIIVSGGPSASTSSSSSAGYGYGLENTSEVVGEEDWWKMDKVESFYRECCEGCGEIPDPQVTAAFKHATTGNGPGRTVDLSGFQLTLTSASILSDVFSIEWGLRKLVCRECDFDEVTLKPILHALLIPNSLSYLSVASNRRLKPPAFRLFAAYLSKSNTLQFLDLSQNSLDKKSIEYIMSALVQLPQPSSPFSPPTQLDRQGLASLKLDDCQLRPASLEVLARAIRTSSLRHISLRHNRINATGAVALAVMIRDYPDVVPSGLSFGGGSSAASTPPNSVPPSPTVTPTSLPPLNPNSSPKTALPPPPRHPSTAPQTTYTPYIPRSKRAQPSSLPQQNQHHNQNHTVPILTSSSQGGVTTLTHSLGNEKNNRHSLGPSAALLDKVRALDALPRLGALRTLDLRGNDLRGGVSYIAQVLKRNRTLRVLNLAENKLDVGGLVAVAEALKYNSTLETLDMSRNPCCGPGLEGIQSLRTAITLNASLKRLFLSSTHLTTSGAIALAEFLPESTSLLHLDLTGNSSSSSSAMRNGNGVEESGIGLAGVMALSEGLKANHVMRCLDVDVRAGDEELARICQDILKTCIRNTEEAEKSNSSAGKAVWAIIEESELARRMRFGNESDNQILTQTRTLIAQLHLFVDGRSPTSLSQTSSPATSSPSTPSPSLLQTATLPNREELISNAKMGLEELVSAIQSSSSSSSSSSQSDQSSPALSAQRMDELLSLHDQLTTLIARAEEPPLLSPTPISGGASPAIGTPVEDKSGEKTKLSLRGLGLKLDTLGISDSDRVRWSSLSDVHRREQGEFEEEGEEDGASTPRVDKGKARAEPEPEAVERVLSPTRLLVDGGILDHIPDDAEEVEVEEEEEEEGSNATDRSKSWVEEEGEVFRKGTVLLGPEEMEGEYDGEELRKELLDAMVERTPRRPPHPEDDYDDGSLPPAPPAMIPHSPPENVPLPSSPPPLSSSTSSPPPRSYISARTRSPSILSVINTPPMTPDREMGKSSVLIQDVNGNGKSILPEGGISGRSVS